MEGILDLQVYFQLSPKDGNYRVFMATWDGDLKVAGKVILARTFMQGVGEARVFQLASTALYNAEISNMSEYDPHAKTNSDETNEQLDLL